MGEGEIWRTQGVACICAEQKGGGLRCSRAPHEIEADRERAASQSDLHSQQGTGKTCPSVTGAISSPGPVCQGRTDGAGSRQERQRHRGIRKAGAQKAGLGK